MTARFSRRSNKVVALWLFNLSRRSQQSPPNDSLCPSKRHEQDEDVLLSRPDRPMCSVDLKQSGSNEVMKSISVCFTNPESRSECCGFREISLTHRNSFASVNDCGEVHGCRLGVHSCLSRAHQQLVRARL